MSGGLVSTLWATAATLISPMLRANLHRRALNGREIAKRMPERYGAELLSRPDGPLVWVHAASVGETVSILPVLNELSRRTGVLLTTGTVTSQKLLESDGLCGNRVLRRFAPLDVPAWVESFLAHWNPDAACFVESELWPNQIAACRRRGIRLMLLNARMSDQSFRRWQRIPGFARKVVGSFSLIQARSNEDAERFRKLGGAPVTSPGDLKFAAPLLPVDQHEFDRLRRLTLGRPVWLAASTHPKEEHLILNVHRFVARSFPDLLTIIAPRHPERGLVLSLTTGAPRRARGEDPLAGNGIWIADTLGELGLLYRLAPIVFVGRSIMAPGGGQNPLEAARFGCAVAVGPYMANFADHVRLLTGAGGLLTVSDEAALAHFVLDMIENPDLRGEMGDRAAGALAGHSDLPRLSAEALLSLARKPGE